MPLGSCPQSVPGRARCSLPCALWTVHWWIVAMSFSPIQNWNKDFASCHVFCYCPDESSLLCPGSGGYLGFAVTHSLPEPPSNLFSLHRAVAAAPLTSFWGIICPELWIIQCFCKSHWNNLPKHCRVFGVEDGTGLLCALWHWVTEGLRWEIPTALWQGWFSRMQ